MTRPAACCSRSRIACGYRIRASFSSASCSSDPVSPPSRAAIVTLVRWSELLIRDWIAYHRAIGFSHLFIFFDDPAELDASGLQSSEQLTFIPYDASIGQPHSYGDAPGLNTRQELCANHAMRMSAARG